MTSSSSWDAMPCEAQIAEMPKHTLDCPMFNREEFARLGEEWKLTFQYTHITPLLKERYHTLSLLQRNDGDVHLVIFDKGRPHGWWQWYAKNNKVISCDETNKVLNENYEELKTLIQNIYDDAILIGCDEDDLKKKIRVLIDELDFSLGKK